MFYVKFADIGEGIHEGVLLKRFYKTGDEVHDGDTLFILETDKVNAEIPSPVDGTISEVRFKPGDPVNVGQVIMVIDDGTDEIRSNMEGGEPLGPSAGQSEPTQKTAAQSESVSEDGSTAVVGQIEISSEVIPSSGEGFEKAHEVKSGGKVLATPVSRQLAKDLGIDIQTVQGTGPQGRVMKEDILKAKAESKAESKAETTYGRAVQETAKSHAGSVRKTGGVGVGPTGRPPYGIPENGRTERVKMTALRRTIADNMALSKFTIPHTALMDEIDVTELVAFKKKVKGTAEAHEVKLTYLAFFVKAVIRALKAYPYLNASLDEAAGEIVLKQFYNIGIAVDTPDGLMVPVIKEADRLSIFEIAEAIDRLSTRARERTITLDELSDGSFSITNYGSVGAGFGVPVIKHPEAGILGFGSIVKKPVVIDDEIVIRSILPVSLSFDHRIIDGADAGRFVGVLKQLLSDPELLLLNG
ncbi:MAG: hypothetical protein PWQ12_241 [Clostridiales bacterium]|jgi:pyruvate dehydrogenase E2 component (dihydrolipoamide acetyltransferase)|nr:hypothetical protein [Clostridiales bacterium]